MLASALERKHIFTVDRFFFFFSREVMCKVTKNRFD